MTGALWSLHLLLQLTGSKMQDMPAPSPRSPFGLEGEQYWSKPLQQQGAMDFASDLVDKDVDGIFIDAPPTVYLDQHKTVPLAAIRSGSTAKLQRFSLNTTTRLVVTHLETGKIQIVKPGEAPVPDPDEPAPSPGWTVQDLQVDMAEALDLGPRLGRYAAWMICGPESSNQRVVALFPGIEAEAGKEAREGLARLHREGGPPQPLLIGKTVDLIHEPRKPADGKTPVWKLSLVPDGQGKHRLHLEYRLEGLPRFTYPKDRPHLDEKGKRVYANLPLLLVGFDENRSPVLVKNLGLPVMAEPGGDEGRPILSGHVSLDLGALVKRKASSKALTLWAFSMDQACMAEIEWSAGKKAD